MVSLVGCALLLTTGQRSSEDIRSQCQKDLLGHIAGDSSLGGEFREALEDDVILERFAEVIGWLVLKSLIVGSIAMLVRGVIALSLACYLFGTLAEICQFALCARKWMIEEFALRPVLMSRALFLILCLAIVDCAFLSYYRYIYAIGN